MTYVVSSDKDFYPIVHYFGTLAEAKDFLSELKGRLTQDIENSRGCKVSLAEVLECAVIT